MGFERRFEFGLSWFERVLVDKNRKTSLLLFFAPPSLMLLLCMPANVSELTFAVSQITNRPLGYEQQQGR